MKPGSQYGLVFRPVGRLTAGDIMLVQKIALETDEQATLAVANRFHVQAAQRPFVQTPGRCATLLEANYEPASATGGVRLMKLALNFD